jgi:hypothetical protein
MPRYSGLPTGERIYMLRMKTRFRNTTFINMHAFTEHTGEEEKNCYTQSI